MNEKAVQVLLVEDNENDAQLLRHMFKRERPGSFELTHLVRMGDALRRLAEGGVDIVLLDYDLDGKLGTPFLEWAKARGWFSSAPSPSKAWP